MLTLVYQLQYLQMERKHLYMEPPVTVKRWRCRTDHDNYSGWAALRYGVGGTLFKYNDNMEVGAAFSRL